MKHLIVNADDFGQSEGITRGILEAHEHGIVTSTSLMVRWPGCASAVRAARAHPRLSLGIHLDLGEWHLDEDGWRPRYEVVPIADPLAAAEEIDRQLASFVDLVGQPPSHVDSHQHVHLRPELRPLVEARAVQLGASLRHCDPRVRYCGDFYGQDTDGTPLPDRVSEASLVRILMALPDGHTELACHPGDPSGLDTTYRSERLLELAILTSPRIRNAVRELGIELCSFEAPCLAGGGR